MLYIGPDGQQIQIYPAPPPPPPQIKELVYTNNFENFMRTFPPSLGHAPDTQHCEGFSRHKSPDPTLESASPSPPQGSFWHRFNIDSTLIRHRFPHLTLFRCRINVESMSNRCQIEPWGGEGEADSRVGSGGPVPNKPSQTQQKLLRETCSEELFIHGFAVTQGGSNFRKKLPATATGKNHSEDLVSANSQTHPNLHSPVWVGSKCGRPQRGGTNLGVFVLCGRSPRHPHDRPCGNKHTQICTPRWGRPRFEPTQTGLCKFGWVWSSLIVRLFFEEITWLKITSK